MRGVEDVPGKSYRVTGMIERVNELVEKATMFADSEALHVLENECTGIKFGNEAHEFKNQAVTRVFKGAMAD